MTTNEEAIKKLESELKYCLPVSDYRDALLMAIKSLQKKIPRKMVYESDGYADGYPVWDKAWCPWCGMRFDYDDDNWKVAKFCPRCGQALDWEMEVEDDEGHND